MKPNKIKISCGLGANLKKKKKKKKIDFGGVSLKKYNYTSTLTQLTTGLDSKYELSFILFKKMYG